MCCTLYIIKLVILEGSTSMVIGLAAVLVCGLLAIAVILVVVVVLLRNRRRDKSKE